MAVSSTSSTASNIYSSLSAKNKGVGGLASGLDTDSLVEALTSGTRGKIAKQGQQKQLLQWKQSAYRTLGSALSAFKVKNFSLAGGATQSIKSNAFFNAYKGSSSSSSITVKPTTTATPGNVTVDKVTQLATNQSWTTAKFDKDLKSGSINFSTKDPSSYIGQKLELSFDGGPVKSISLDSLASITPGDTATLATTLQGLVDTAFGKNSQNQSLINVAIAAGDTVGENRISLDSLTSTVKVENGGTANVLGFSQNASNRISTNTTVGELFGSTGAGVSGKDIMFNINGVDISAKTTDTLSTVMSRINNSTAGVRLNFNSITEDFTISTKQSGAGDTLKVKDIQGDFMNKLFGVAGGNSLFTDNIGATHGYLTTVDGGTFTGENYKDIVNSIGSANTAKIDVTLNGNKQTLAVSFTAAEMTAFQTTLNTASGVSGFDFATDYAGLSDGHKKAVDLEYEKLLGTKIQTEINTKFPTDKSSLNVFIDNDGKIGFKTANDSVTLKIEPSTLGGTDVDLFGSMGYSGASVVNDPAGSGKKLVDINTAITPGSFNISVGGSPNYTFNFTAATTMSDMQKEINAHFGKEVVKIENGKLSISGGDDSLSISDTSGDFIKTTFGVESGSYTTAASAPTYTAVVGKNAEIEVGGQIISSTTNNFKVNGLDFTVNSTDANPITLGVSTEPQELVDKIKSFIDDYNAIIITLNQTISEQKVSGYTPLTDEQKADMSEDQIKKWEIEAKKGLLSADPALRRITDQFRSSLYGKIEAAGLSIYDIGITTDSLFGTSGTANYNNSGTLTVDEAKLTKAIESNLDGVRTIFTDETDGIVARFENIIEEAIRTDSTRQGSLVHLAGTEAITGNNESVISKKIDMIDKAVSTLKMRLESEYNRYWKKFSALETAISRMSSQSSWLTQNA